MGAQARFLGLMLLGCLLLLLVLLRRRRLDVLLLGIRRHLAFLCSFSSFFGQAEERGAPFPRVLQDMLCKTALALGVHAQEQVCRHRALAQARVEVVRLLLHAVLVHLGRFIALSEPAWMHRAQGLGRKRLLTKGSAFASDIFGGIAFVVYQGLVMPAAADKLVGSVVGGAAGAHHMCGLIWMGA